MKFKAEQSTFTKALFNCAHILDKSPWSPILACVYIEASMPHQAVILRVNNLGLSFETKIDATVLDGGKILISCRILDEAIKKMSKGEVTFDLDSETFKVALSNGKVKTNVYGTPADEFPWVAVVDSFEPIMLPVATLAQLLLDVEHAAGHGGQGKAFAASIYLYAGAGTLTACATDTHRLSESSINANATVEVSALLPSGYVKRIVAALPKAGDVSLSLGKSNIKILFEGSEFVIRQLGAKFPDYKVLIPATAPACTIEVDKSALLFELDGLLPATGSTGGAMIGVRDGKLLMEARDFSVGDVRRTLDVSVTSEPSWRCMYNVDYLIEAVKSMRASTVKIAHFAVERPLVIRPGLTGEDGTKQVALVMPIKKDAWAEKTDEVIPI